MNLIQKMACELALAIARTSREEGDLITAERAMIFARRMAGVQMTPMPAFADHVGNLHFAPTLAAARATALSAERTY